MKRYRKQREVSSVRFNSSLQSTANFDSTGYIDIANFDSSNTDDALVKTVLIATPGEFKDSNGNKHKFTESRLDRIAKFTNLALENGKDVPLCKDHKKTVDFTIGKVGGKAYTKVITESDLPNKRAKHLIGKVGLFMSDVIVTDKPAIEKIKSNTINSVSMGLNLDPDDERILEVSLVPIPAIDNMGMFGFGINNEDNAYTWDDLEANQQTLDDLKDEYNDLTDDLWTLLNNVYNSNAIQINDLPTLLQYVYSALNGFSTRVIDLLGLTNVEEQMNQATDPTNMPILNADEKQQMQQTQYQDLASTNASQYSKYTRKSTANFNYQVYATTKKYLRGVRV